MYLKKVLQLFLFYIYLKTFNNFILKVQHCYRDIHHDVTTHAESLSMYKKKWTEKWKWRGVWMQRAIIAVGQCFQWCHFPLHYCLYNRNMEAGGHEPLYALYTARHCLASGYWNHFNKTTGTGKIHSDCSRNSHFPSVCSPQQTQPACDCIPSVKR